MRAPSEVSGVFALECALDELAVALGMDPVELRLRNDAERDEHDGLLFSSRALRESFRVAAERFGWPPRDPRPASMRDAHGRLVGYGCAAATYPVNVEAASARVCLRPVTREGSTQNAGSGRGHARVPLLLPRHLPSP